VWRKTSTNERYANTSICARTYIHTYIRTCIPTSIPPYTHTPTRTHAHTHLQALFRYHCAAPPSPLLLKLKLKHKTARTHTHAHKDARTHSSTVRACISRAHRHAHANSRTHKRGSPSKEEHTVHDHTACASSLRWRACSQHSVVWIRQGSPEVERPAKTARTTDTTPVPRAAAKVTAAGGNTPGHSTPGV
jgi:hypothetical protein